MFSYFAGSVLHVGWPKPCFLRAKTKPKTPPRCAAPRSVEPVGKKWGTTSVLPGWYLIELLINTGWKNFLIGYCSLLGRRRMVPQLRIVNNSKKKLKHPQAQSPIATSQALWRSLDVLEVSLLATKSSQWPKGGLPRINGSRQQYQRE